MSEQEQEQCMQALVRANRVRLPRAELKRKIGRGEVSVADVIGPGRRIPFEAKSMPIGQLLAAQRSWGATRARKYLAHFGISESRQLSKLTKRERGLLVESLETPPRELRNRQLLAA